MALNTKDKKRMSRRIRNVGMEARRENFGPPGEDVRQGEKKWGSKRVLGARSLEAHYVR